jgi:Uma2 family endonuclease
VVIDAAHGSENDAPRQYTAEQLMEISQDDTHRYELVQGELITMTPAGFEHGRIAIRLGAHMQVYVEDNRLGSVCAAETGFRIASKPDTVLAPDVGFVRVDRVPEGRLPAGYFPGAPDLAVEVLSPNDTSARTQNKVEMWLRHGAQLVWVVEPDTQTVHVYRADGSVSLLHVGDALDGEKLLPGFTYPLARLFGVETATR